MGGTSGSIATMFMIAGWAGHPSIQWSVAGHPQTAFPSDYLELVVTSLIAMISLRSALGRNQPEMGFRNRAARQAVARSFVQHAIGLHPRVDGCTRAWRAPRNTRLEHRRDRAAALRPGAAALETRLLGQGATYSASQDAGISAHRFQCRADDPRRMRSRAQLIWISSTAQFAWPGCRPTDKGSQSSAAISIS